MDYVAYVKDRRQATQAGQQGSGTSGAARSGVPTMILGSASTAGNSMHTGTSTLTHASGTSGTSTPNTVRQSNIHPKIKTVMGSYLARVGKLQITRIMNLAGVTWDAMPKLATYTAQNGTNTLCYNYVLGRCNPQYCTHHSGHTPSTDVTDEFANSLCTLLQPGLSAMTKDLADASWTDFKAIVESRAASASQS